MTQPRMFPRNMATALWQVVVSYDAGTRRFYWPHGPDPTSEGYLARIEARDAAHEAALREFCAITGWMPTPHTYLDPRLAMRLQAEGLLAVEQDGSREPTLWTLEAPDRKFPPYSFGRWTKGDEGQPNYRDRIYLNGGILLFADKVWFTKHADGEDGEAALQYTGAFCHPQYTSCGDEIPPRFAANAAIKQFDAELDLDTVRWSDLCKWAALPKPGKRKDKTAGPPANATRGSRYRVVENGKAVEKVEEEAPF